MVTAARDVEFERFVRTYRPSLVRFAATLAAGDAHLAEDLVQVALVRVYLARPSKIGGLHAYVRRAVVNGLIDHKRRSVTRHESATANLPEREVREPVTDVDPELLSALAELPARMRAAVVLRHVEGLSVDETADLLRCSTGNVKSQTARGLAKLREVLGLDDTTATTVNDAQSPAASTIERT